MDSATESRLTLKAAARRRLHSPEARAALVASHVDLPSSFWRVPKTRSVSSTWLAQLRALARSSAGSGTIVVLGVRRLDEMMVIAETVGADVTFVTTSSPLTNDAEPIATSTTARCSLIDPRDLDEVATRGDRWSQKLGAIAGGPIVGFAATVDVPGSTAVGVARAVLRIDASAKFLLLEVPADLSAEIRSALEAEGGGLSVTPGETQRGGPHPGLVFDRAVVRLERDALARDDLFTALDHRSLTEWRASRTIADLVRGSEEQGRSLSTVSTETEVSTSPELLLQAPRVSVPFSPLQLRTQVHVEPALWFKRAENVYMFQGTFWTLESAGDNRRLAASGEGRAIRYYPDLPLHDAIVDREFGEPRVVTTPSEDAFNYYHWIIDTFPKLLALKAESAFEGRLCLVGAEQTFQIETLELIGITSYDRVSSRTGVVFRDLTTVGPIAATRLRTLYRPFVTAADHSRRSSPFIYISREDSEYRRIVNEHEIAPILNRLGFETVVLEGLSVLEQARLFTAARVVVGPHGAGLANLVFCTPGVHVLEIGLEVRIEDGQGGVFWRLANALDLTYYLLIADRVVVHDDNPGDGALRVDPKALSDLLARVMRDAVMESGPS